VDESERQSALILIASENSDGRDRLNNGKDAGGPTLSRPLRMLGAASVYSRFKASRCRAPEWNAPTTPGQYSLLIEKSVSSPRRRSSY
jgi:hypothetical protein